MSQKMRIKTALIGVESFSAEGLKSARKEWNPVGRRMVEAIDRIQNNGIMVLSSVISGLESDTVQTIRTFALILLSTCADHSSFPVFESNALNRLSLVAPIKTTPPAVAIGPNGLTKAKAVPASRPSSRIRMLV
jgi:hypothetical protein